MGRMIDIDAVAELFDAHSTTVRRWLKYGVLRVAQQVRNKVFFDEDEVLELIPSRIRSLTLIKPSTANVIAGIKENLLEVWVHNGILTEFNLPHYMPGQTIKRGRYALEEIKAALRAGSITQHSHGQIYTVELALERLGVDEPTYLAHLADGAVDLGLPLRNNQVPYGVRRYAVYLFHQGLLTI